MKTKPNRTKLFHLLLLVSLVGCVPAQPSFSDELMHKTETAESSQPMITVTAQPTRPVYEPGELVDYTVQTGDTLHALAAHFNTTEKEILQENPVIPNQTTTLPPGLPLKIPIYYQALWGSSYQIIPDCLFPNGPAQVGFDPVQYVNDQPGWFKKYSAYTGSKTRTGGELIQYISDNFSISPRLLLALVEYRTGALTNPVQPDEDMNPYPFGLVESLHKGLYQQLILSTNLLNNGYYEWRTGDLREYDLADGSLVVPDPWQNAATVALQYVFGQAMSGDEFTTAIHGQGFIQTYENLFGDAWSACEAHIPGSLTQPQFILPFEGDKTWAYTGGPHTGWGDGPPFAAVDFAPPNIDGGCVPSDQYAAAVADGVIVRTDTAVAVLDLDGDGNEQTGWVVFYLHLATDSIPPVGTYLHQGDRIGLPSCEGGRATGTHVHIARKYNGEWIPAGGSLPLVLDGWTTRNGDEAYDGYLDKFGRTIIASIAGDVTCQISREIKKNSP